jgi:hypothetical protein
LVHIPWNQELGLGVGVAPPVVVALMQLWFDSSGCVRDVKLIDTQNRYVVAGASLVTVVSLLDVWTRAPPSERT